MLTGGAPEGVDPADLEVGHALVIAADGGVQRALALGLQVDLVVGDLDSVERGTVEATGARLDLHGRNKDRTDLELALDAAVAHGARRVLVVGGAGGRVDHYLANLLVLASPAYADAQVDALLGGARVAVVRDRRVLTGRPGDLLSLLAVHGPALGVRTEGLGYVLAGEDLHPGSTRGVSNVFSAPTATVTLRAGILLAVQPGEG